MTKPLASVLELSLEERAEMALKAAVEKVIVEHARQGLPIYTCAMAESWRFLPMNCERKRPS